MLRLAMIGDPYVSAPWATPAAADRAGDRLPVRQPPRPRGAR